MCLLDLCVCVCVRACVCVCVCVCVCMCVYVWSVAILNKQTFSKREIKEFQEFQFASISGKFILSLHS